MRRYWVLALAVLTLLGGLAPPAFAQAPAPKVTIQGLFNLVTAWSSNFQDADSTRRETEWYSRQRGRLDFIGELGKTRMVWGIEIDTVNGNTVTNHAGTGGTAGQGTGFDLDTDVPGIVETKWLYLEFPLTGKDSMLPMIDVPSIARGGGQPFAGHDYKIGILATGDFGGLNIVTTFAPTVKNTLTFVQIEEKNFGGEKTGPAAAANATNRESWAIIESLEFSPTKELTVKPTFSWARFNGANQGSSIATPSRGGLTLTGEEIWRATIGGDLRWRSGPWSLEPTFHYQWGQQELLTTNLAAGAGQGPADISAWIFDVIGGWRSGPLNLEGRFVYTSGNDADECVQSIPAASGATCRGGSDINYYTPINAGFVYFAGWSETWTSALDYAQTFLAGGGGGVRRGQSIGHDKYGLITFAARATYAVTPAFSLVGIVSPAWTTEDVDTNGAFALASGITPALRTGETRPRGDENYLGTEIVGGFTWMFAPGVDFNMRYSHLFAGDALNQCQVAACAVNGLIRDAKDVQRLTARVNYSF